jgi:hypothetical protein
MKLKLTASRMVEGMCAKAIEIQRRNSFDPNRGYAQFVPKNGKITIEDIGRAVEYGRMQELDSISLDPHHLLNYCQVEQKPWPVPRETPLTEPVGVTPNAPVTARTST